MSSTRIALGLIVLCASSCARQPVGLHVGLHEHARLPEMAMVGSPVVFEYFLREERAVLTSAITTPSGASLPSAVSEWLESDFPRDFGAKVTFSPREVGSHLITVSVESDEFVSSLYALQPHGPWMTSLNRSCSWVERFADGAWLCDGVLLRGSEEPQPLDAELSAVAGDVVWIFKSGRLERVREPLPGASFGPGDALDLGLTAARTLLPTESGVLVVHSSGVVRVEPDAAGGLVVTAQLQQAISTSAVVRRDGSSLLIADGLVPFVLGIEPSSPHQPRDGQSQLWVFSLGDNGITDAGSRRYDGIVRGECDDGVLLSAGFEIRAVSASLDDGVELALPPPLNAAMSTTPRGLARLGEGVIPKKADGQLWLQSFQGATGASDRLVWVASSNRTVVLSR